MARVTQEYIDARTREILKAAGTLFARKGFDGATMQEVARAAGLSAGAIYRYYPSKDGLIRAVFELTLTQSRGLFEGSENDGCRPRRSFWPACYTRRSAPRGPHCTASSWGSPSTQRASEACQYWQNQWSS